MMLGAETEEKLFDAPLSISKREQLEQQVGLGALGQALPNPAKPCTIRAMRAGLAGHQGDAADRVPTGWLLLTHPLRLPQVPENYFYVPDLGQVPEIDVPSYLPDLPGIADDLTYSADLGPGIAPSAPGTTPELPAFQTEVAESFKPGGH